MRILKILKNRVFITAIIILIQLGWFLTFFLKLTEYSNLIHFFFNALSIIIVLFIISYDNNPSYKIAWIVLIMALPLLGGLLYLFFGTSVPQYHLRKKLSATQEQLLPFLHASPTLLDEIEDKRIAGSLRYLESHAGYPLKKNTSTKYYPLGELQFADMLQALNEATDFIFMEYFILEEGVMWNQIFEILKRKAKEGVDVRLIYDDIGSALVLPQNFAKRMENEGIRCIAFNPVVPVLALVMNNRDHRKIMVIDGKLAFSGGINIADEYINHFEKHGHWKDTGIRLVGEAVDNFTLMFLEIWHIFRNQEEDITKFIHKSSDTTSDSYVLPFSDSPLDKEAVGKNIYLDMLHSAKDYVYIFTPYLIVDDEVQNALRYAAKRGVDIRIITPGIPDKKIVYRTTRSYYRILLEAGVKIYEYTPGFLHAKSFVSDDATAIVGTINMDYRSMFLHFECGTYLYQDPCVADVKADFLETQAQSKEILLEQTNTTFFAKLVNDFIRVFSPLM